MPKHLSQGDVCPKCGKEILNMLFEGHRCNEIDIIKKELTEARKLIRKQGRELGRQDVFIEELKSQIPCPACNARGYEKRYCPECKVVCSPQETTFDGHCIDCKTKLIDCPECKGTGKKYPPLNPAS